MLSYARYCADLERFGQPVIFSEDEYERKYGEPIKEEKLVETRKKEPTLRLAVSEPKASIKKPPKPIIVKVPKEPYKSKRKTDRVMTPKVSHASLSVEEIKEHKAALAKAWRAKRKEEGKSKTRPRTDEDREKAKVWYLNNQEKVKAKTKAYRQSIASTPEGKEAARIRMKEWRANNKERANKISRDAKKRKREKKMAEENYPIWNAVLTYEGGEHVLYNGEECIARKGTNNIPYSPKPLEDNNLIQNTAINP